MARKSAAALAVVSHLRERPEPPGELSADEAEVWRSIVATKPPEWFAADTFPLLTAYCRAHVAARVVAEMVGRAQEESDAATYLRLIDAQGRISGTLCTLATKMRLSQQSRYGARGAEGAARRAEASPVKPWEFGKQK